MRRTSDRTKRRPRAADVHRLLLYLGVLFLLSFSWMHDKITVPNERTRVYLAVSIIDEGTFAIDNALKRFGKTADIARFEGRYYTDKAPGAGFLGALLYGGVRLFTPKESWTIDTLINLMRSYLMIPLGLLGFWLLRRTLSMVQISGQTTDLISIAYILGTSAFHYSTAFYGHQMAAVGLLLAVYMVVSAQHRPSAHKMVVAGASIGFAGIMEFQSAAPAVLAVFWIIIAFRRVAPVAQFLAGAAPFAVLLLFYNWACFGGPFELSYHHLVSKQVQSLHSLGIGGVSTPKAEAAFGSMLSLHRGLLATSPVFLALPVGLWLMVKSRYRNLSYFIGGVVIFYLWFIFSADAWYAGWAFGPRLLVPMMAIAMIPLAYGAERLRNYPWLAGAIVGAVVVGIAYHQVVHVVFPELPETAKNPIKDLVIAALERGTLSPNLISTLRGAPASWSPLVAAAVLLGLTLATIHPYLKTPPKKSTRVKQLVGSAVPLIVFVFAVTVTPRAWSEARTERHLNWMTLMDNTQYPSPNRQRH